MRSMTGYGAGSAEKESIRVDIQIRSVNGRFGEIRLKLPSELVPYEAELRRQVSERIRRGRADVQISVASEELPPVDVRLNRNLAARYLEASEELKRQFGLEGTVNLSDLLGVPGLMEVQPAGKDAAGEPLLEVVREALATALEAHDGVRRREGARLRSDLEARIGTMETIRQEISRSASKVPEAVRDKLLERISKLVSEDQLDAGRLEQEAAYLADRADITEELVRLEAHLKAGHELLAVDGEPVGKKLEFLLQEIGRETNTIGSKSSDLEITRNALAIKAEAEKLREQVQNLE
jgi:uncharacterized protein (TIGR00255 family)